MFAFHQIAQLERLIEFVICLVGFVIKNHMNVISFSRRRIFMRFVAFQIAGEMKLNRDVRTTHNCIFGRRDDVQLWLRLILLAALLHKFEN